MGRLCATLLVPAVCEDVALQHVSRDLHLHVHIKQFNLVLFIYFPYHPLITTK